MSKSTKQKGPNYWVEDENGYEKNSSPDIIRKALNVTKTKRQFVVILHKGYQSGSTVIVEIGKDFLTIDKPVDWPGLDKIRVVFKDESQIWNYFAVNVISDKEDTVKTQFPTELFRLQRRAHFRINVPNGSFASFMKKEQEFTDVTVGNISIGGIMVCLAPTDPHGDLNDFDEITNVVVTIPKEEQSALTKEEEAPTSDLYEVISVGRGTVVRSFVDDTDTVKYCVGIKFELKAGEEERLQKFVRHRELEMLRKGILDL